MAKASKRTNRHTGQGEPAVDPARERLALMRRARRTQLDLAQAALQLARSVKSSRAWLRRSLHDIANEMGYICISKQQWESVQQRIDELTARTAQRLDLRGKSVADDADVEPATTEVVDAVARLHAIVVARAKASTQEAMEEPAGERDAELAGARG